MSQYRSGKMVKFLCEGCHYGWFDHESVSYLLRSIAKIINMTPLAGPYTAEVNDEGDKNGISGVLIIKESHIAVHEWSSHMAVRIVIDSCEDFGYDGLIKFFSDFLVPSDIVMYEEQNGRFVTG